MEKAYNLCEPNVMEEKVLKSVIDNLSDYNIPDLGGEVKAIRICGEKSCEKILNIIEKNFCGKTLILKASGMLEELNHLQKYISSNIYFSPADSKKLFIKKFPEMLSILPDYKTLKKVLDDWICTIYERRIIYIVDKVNVETIVSILKEKKFETSTCIADIWSLVVGIVENIPDAPEHNNFIVLTKENEMKKIIG